MGFFSRKNDAAETEYREAKRALRNDPVNTGAAGVVDIDSPAGRQNLEAQDRLSRAEKARRR